MVNNGTITKRKATIKFKLSPEHCFQNVYHQMKSQFKKVGEYERDATYLNMNKGRSKRKITTTTQENIEAARQSLERTQGKISASRMGLGILLNLFIQK